MIRTALELSLTNTNTDQQTWPSCHYYSQSAIYLPGTLYGFKQILVLLQVLKSQKWSTNGYPISVMWLTVSCSFQYIKSVLIIPYMVVLPFAQQQKFCPAIYHIFWQIPEKEVGYIWVSLLYIPIHTWINPVRYNCVGYMTYLVAP